MARTQAEQKLPASAEAVWEVIGGFGALGDWHPAIEKLELQDGGKLRRLHLAGGGLIVERLEAHDDHARHYSYTIVEGPLPVADYHSTLKVEAEPGGHHCVVHWSGHFKAQGISDAEAEKVVYGVYRGGLDALKQRFT